MQLIWHMYDNTENIDSFKKTKEIKIIIHMLASNDKIIMETVEIRGRTTEVQGPYCEAAP